MGQGWLDLGTSPVYPMFAGYTDPSPLALSIHDSLGSEISTYQSALKPTHLDQAGKQYSLPEIFEVQRGFVLTVH